MILPLAFSINRRIASGLQIIAVYLIKVDKLGTHARIEWGFMHVISRHPHEEQTKQTN